MNIVDTNNSVDKEKLFNFCKECFAEVTMPANINMDIEDWQNKSHTLLHALYIQKRFVSEKRAGYFLLERDSQYVAGSGLYEFELDKNICVMAARTYTVKSERAKTLHSKYIFPILENKAIEYGYKTLILTFNEYNIWLKNLVEKVSNGNSMISNTTTNFLKNWKTLNFPVTIKNSKQYVLYKHIDGSYDSEFQKIMEKIRVHES